MSKFWICIGHIEPEPHSWSHTLVYQLQRVAHVLFVGAQSLSHLLDRLTCEACLLRERNHGSLCNRVELTSKELLSTIAWSPRGVQTFFDKDHSHQNRMILRSIDNSSLNSQKSLRSGEAIRKSRVWLWREDCVTVSGATLTLDNSAKPGLDAATQQVGFDEHSYWLLTCEMPELGLLR
ncbi:hypothetical protein CPB86DRAFT_339870 [Serendipita vermifera]|nr:hypothetical protein CPB86DRAFT_339870 [Serendipita vermifera]